MGGLGSGSWVRDSKKSTVDGSCVLAMRDFRARLYQNSAGTVTWTSAGGSKSSVGFIVTLDGESPTLTLSYLWRGMVEIELPIPLESTPTQFGGRRWWFNCPMDVRGVICQRRAGKLYLPFGTQRFGCRKCHDLTYRSSQEAHQTERTLTFLGFGPDAARLFPKPRTMGVKTDLAPLAPP
jgi:hypothetical protein